MPKEAELSTAPRIPGGFLVESWWIPGCTPGFLVDSWLHTRIPGIPGRVLVLSTRIPGLPGEFLIDLSTSYTLPILIDI